MDTKKMEELLAAVGKEKRAELLEKLKGAKDEQERQAIVKEYGVAPDTKEPDWLADSYDLTNEELAMIAGGAEMPWDYDVDDTCCN